MTGTRIEVRCSYHAARAIEEHDGQTLCDISNDDRTVGVCSKDQPGSSIELDRHDLAMTRIELALQRTARGAPHLRCALAIPRDDQLVVRRERDGVYRLAELAEVL